MESRGKVTGGVVVPDRGVSLPEGAEVRILVETRQAATFGQRLMKFAGRARELPKDLAENHDHYLHGAGRSPIASRL